MLTLTWWLLVAAGGAAYLVYELVRRTAPPPVRLVPGLVWIGVVVASFYLTTVAGGVTVFLGSAFVASIVRGFSRRLSGKRGPTA